MKNNQITPNHFLHKALNDNKEIFKIIKDKWLKTLNNALVSTEGKAHPKDIITAKFGWDFFVKINPSFERKLSDEVKNGFDGWYFETYQLFLWLISKNRYIVPQEIIPSLHQDLDLTAIPSAPLFNLPEWTTFIPFKLDERLPEPDCEDILVQHGMFVSEIKYEGKDYLFIKLHCSYRREGTGEYVPAIFSTGIDRDSKSIAEGYEKAKSGFNVMLSDALGHMSFEDTMLPDAISILLFITGEHSKTNIDRKTGKRIYPAVPKGGWRITPSVKIKEVEIGGEVIAAHRTYETSKEFNGRRSHFRRGHFRTYWLGPRSSEQTSIVHWIPPMVVKGSIKGDEPL